MSNIVPHVNESIVNAHAGLVITETWLNIENGRSVNEDVRTMAPGTAIGLAGALFAGAIHAFNQNRRSDDPVDVPKMLHEFINSVASQFNLKVEAPDGR